MVGYSALIERQNQLGCVPNRSPSDVKLLALENIIGRCEAEADQAEVHDEQGLSKPSTSRLVVGTITQNSMNQNGGGSDRSRELRTQ